MANTDKKRMTEEELDTDALLRMAEEEAFRQDELARAREADRRRREEDRRRREEEHRSGSNPGPILVQSWPNTDQSGPKIRIFQRKIPLTGKLQFFNKKLENRKTLKIKKT